MKKERFGSYIAAILGLFFIQIGFCSSANADGQWTAPAVIGYKQANQNSDGTFSLKQSGTQLTGTAINYFSIPNYELGFIRNGVHVCASQGQVLFGSIVGNRFDLTVKYAEAPNSPFRGGTFRYEGTINQAGFVVGEVYDQINPNNKIGWHTELALVFVNTPTPAPPPPAVTPSATVPKPVRITGQPSDGSGTRQPGPNLAPWVDYNGDWETILNSGRKFLMTLSQDGDLVRGTYKLVEATTQTDGNIKGWIDADGKLTFNWIQRGADPGMGTGVFITARDSQSFQGTFATQFPRGSSGGTWGGKRIASSPPLTQSANLPMGGFGGTPVQMGGTPPPMGGPGSGGIGGGPGGGPVQAVQPSFTGTWNIAVAGGSNRFVMNLTQNENSVTGTYSPHNGSLSGQIGADGKLVYRWSDSSGARGSGQFSLTNNGTSINGNFSNNDDPTAVNGMWGGTR